jgi:hypothetical protein
LDCFDLKDPINYSGALSAVISRDLEPSEQTVDGRRQMGRALLYWGLGGPGNTEYCAIVADETADGLVNHQFCTPSADSAVRARIREVAGSYESVGSSIEPTQWPFSG